MQLEPYTLRIDDLDLAQQLELLEFSADQPPMHFESLKIPDDVLSKMFKVEQLDKLYKEMRFYSY